MLRHHAANLQIAKFHVILERETISMNNCKNSFKMSCFYSIRVFVSKNGGMALLRKDFFSFEIGLKGIKKSRILC